MAPSGSPLNVPTIPAEASRTVNDNPNGGKKLGSGTSATCSEPAGAVARERLSRAGDPTIGVMTRADALANTELPLTLRTAPAPGLTVALAFAVIRPTLPVPPSVAPEEMVTGLFCWVPLTSKVPAPRVVSPE